jgi:magnesium and cobalt transporter
MHERTPPKPPAQDIKSAAGAPSEGNGFLNWIRTFIKPEAEATLRETIDDYINDQPQERGEGTVSAQEHVLLSNILKLRDLAVVNVMIPRADIVAIDLGTTQEELLALLAEKQFSRIPVYRGTLDDVLGTIHIKDILATLAKGQTLNIKELVKEIPIVSPAMPVLDLLLTMRESRRHMALVVDEFGGIDGLVTVNDVLETIVGQIEDEHDKAQEANIIQKSDGSYLLDGRLRVEDFENRFGKILNDDERDAADTLSGLVFAMEGRIPGRGEVLTHSSGMIFEITDADARRINLLKITNIPSKAG